MATRHSSPSLTTRVLVGGIATVVVLLGATVVSYGLFSMIASPAAPAPASPTPAVALGAIAGRVWHDLCAVDTSHQGAASAASTGCVLSAGGEVQADGAFESGEPPLAGASVVLGAGACPATPWKETFVLSDGTFVLSDLPPGNYCVSLNAEAQPLQLTPGRWTAPANAAGSPVALIDIALGPGEVKGGADFGWDYQFLPIPEAQPSPAPSPAASPPACTDRAAYLGDVTIPDGTWVLPGTSFEKIWRIQNLGTCTWNSAYVLAFVSGQSMGAAEAAPLLSAVGPGGIADLSVRLTAPLSPGTYRGNWMLRNPSGAFFGIGPDAASAFWVIVNVGDTSTGAGPWRGEYFNNRGLSGSPAVIRDDAVIDFDWQLEAPASGIAADDFSVRWTAEIPFEGGTYDMHLTFDDGARLWIDDEKVFDEWRDGARRERVVTVPLVQGNHDLRLEYYEHAGDARVRLNWSPVTHFADWKGEYFANRDLRGTPALIRNDRDVDFSWGRGSAQEGLPADGFSARWKRTISFDRGRYRLFATADDGVRVFVDDGKVLDEWHESSGSQVYTVDIDLAGRKTIVVEYYERSGQANVHFWFERLVPTPTSTASVTISPTATWTPTATETTPPSPTPSPTVSPTASESPTPSLTPTPSETPTEAPTATATCVPIECGPIIPPG